MALTQNAARAKTKHYHSQAWPCSSSLSLHSRRALDTMHSAKDMHHRAPARYKNIWKPRWQAPTTQKRGSQRCVDVSMM